MTENKAKKGEKSFSVQTVRVSREMLQRIKHRLADTEEDFQGFAIRLITDELKASGIPQKGEPGNLIALNSVVPQKNSSVFSITAEESDMLTDTELQEVRMLLQVLRHSKPHLAAALRNNLVQFHEFAGLWDAQNESRQDANSRPEGSTGDEGGSTAKDVRIHELEQAKARSDEELAQLNEELARLRKIVEAGRKRKRRDVS